MADLTNEEIAKLLEKTMASWYREVYGKLKAQMSAKGLILTGSLSESLNAEITTAADEVKGELKLYFEDHGRFQDMKHRYFGKMPPVEAMLKYIRKVGLDKFRYVPGYPLGVFPTGTSRSKFGTGNRIAENRIAWGLAMSRVAPKNSGKAYGRRKWYAKTFYSSIDELIEAILGKTKELTLDEITQSLTKK